MEAAGVVKAFIFSKQRASHSALLALFFRMHPLVPLEPWWLPLLAMSGAVAITPNAL